MNINVEIKVSKSKQALSVPNKAFRILNLGVKLENYAPNQPYIYSKNYPLKNRAKYVPRTKLFVLDGKTIKKNL